MKFELEEFSVEELVNAYEHGTLVRNPEYQRGAAWSIVQQKALLDSLFRKYPLPAVFLEVKAQKGLGGAVTETHEIIDGQQRLLALQQYKSGAFELLSPDDPKLRLPLSLRDVPAPWRGKRFDDLDLNLRSEFLEAKIKVYLVRDVLNPDEVRDLFIRLQSGTALTRQQIRDAWPGELGPKIERWAGKLAKQPKYRLFEAVDGRGTRDDEDDTSDPFVKHRTTCAQLCQLLISRAEDPFSAPSIKAGDLDGLYQRYTSLQDKETVIQSLEDVFGEVESVMTSLKSVPNGRRKAPKIALFALAMFFQDVRRSRNFKLTQQAKRLLADAVRDPKVLQNSRASSGGVIREYYDAWRNALPPGIGIDLDPIRIFGDDQKRQIFVQCEGTCAICGELVESGQDEYDHFPIPYRDGGRTSVENGRLVHSECHPRGRPRIDLDGIE